APNWRANRRRFANGRWTYRARPPRAESSTPRSRENRSGDGSRRSGCTKRTRGRRKSEAESALRSRRRRRSPHGFAFNLIDRHRAAVWPGQLFEAELAFDGDGTNRVLRYGVAFHDHEHAVEQRGAGAEAAFHVVADQDEFLGALAVGRIHVAANANLLT